MKSYERKYENIFKEKKSFKYSKSQNYSDGAAICIIL